jgi:hypothetical protein
MKFSIYVKDGGKEFPKKDDNLQSHRDENDFRIFYTENYQYLEIVRHQ